MRTAFIRTLEDLASRDERIWLLCGDLGYSVLESFAERFGDRFLNVGIAEANMTGIAAGLALSGKIVFTYSIANFPTLRCLEQIRNDVCYHEANVKIVSVGGGFAYGAQGYTHHGVEDLGVLRLLPNMTVVAPADPVETRLATAAAAEWQGPCYLRLGKAGEAVLHERDPNFSFAHAILVRDGKDVTLISTGGVLGITLQAAKDLERDGASVRVVSMPVIAPADENAIRRALRETSGIVTVEEHGPGGLGSVVADILAQYDVPGRLRMVRLNREAVAVAGTQDSLRSMQGVSVASIRKAACELLAQTGGRT
jgi:transketolase